jgi:hypothetical protein
MGREAGSSLWTEVGTDIEEAEGLTRSDFIRSALWSNGSPGWARTAWSVLRSALPSDEDWDVWIDWYEQRLHGGSRGEAYELAFASVPQAEWDKGPAAANTWIKAHLPVQQNELRRAAADIKDRRSLEAWLRGRSPEVAMMVAGRAALRTAPLAVSNPMKRQSRRLQIADWTSTIYRAGAAALIAAKYPTHIDGPEIITAAAAAFLATASDSDVVAYSGGDATTRAALAAATAVASGPDASAAWAEVRTDVEQLECLGPGAVCDLPLWPRGAPEWATAAWPQLRAALPVEQDWQVWIDWYEERLKGGSRGEEYELVFASVPQEEWDKGPAAANAWIKAHLPKSQEAAPAELLEAAAKLPEAGPAGLPAPLSNVEAPFAYGWTSSQRVTIVAGAQNLPFYLHFSSEEDHRKALEVCRVGGGRLLKSLNDGRYNARKEYGEALEYYLDDLPKTAGAGNILLANDEIRILHAMFIADAEMLPEGLASRLKSVIANQFALNAFYDLVQRHNEAVNAGNWTQPFPLDAAKSFFGAVEDNTPRWFEPEVEKGLRQVEQAEPPVAVLTEPAPASAIDPPPLPPGTPDAQDSWKRQMATAANALWETFLEGRDMPVDKEEWRNAAEELGANVRPIIEFLRAQDEPKE